MKHNVKEYVQNCKIYLKSKRTRQPKAGLHEPLGSPEYPYQRPAIDFIVGFPEAEDPVNRQRCDIIMTIVDGLTKYAKFIPCKTTMDAEQLACIVAKEVFADHGIPEKIISDRDKLFVSKFNTGLRRALHMEEGISTAFHPQTDGQTERMN